jgi:cyanophycin synthetase
VDFLSQDISRSYKEVGGAIVEVNAAPGFRMHMAPSEGKPRDVAGPVIDMLFPPGTPSSIPIAAVTGTNGKTTTARMLAHILKLAGQVVGLTTTDGVYIDGQRTVAGDMTGPVAARMVLADPFVDVAVLEVARGGLLRAGLGVRQVDVGAVLNVREDHLGMHGINSLRDLAKVKRIVVEVARDTAILNADDPLCLKMADHTPARHLCYVTMNPGHELVREHIQAGGRGCVLEAGMTGQMITLYDHGAHIPLLAAHLIPATLDGRATHNVQNAMFAAAMAFSMGLKLENIRHGLQTFDTTFFQAPGRGNVFSEHPFKVILDYGHNAAAVEAMVQFVERLGTTGRRIVVITSPGDRRDEDMLAMAASVAGYFDLYICREDDNRRGRAPGEIPALLRDGLLSAGVPEEAIRMIPDEQAAVSAALSEAHAGDLLLIFGDNVARCWEQIVTFKPVHAERRAVRRPVDGQGATVPPDERATPRAYVRDVRGVRLARDLELGD